MRQRSVAAQAHHLLDVRLPRWIDPSFACIAAWAITRVTASLTTVTKISPELMA